MDSWLGQFGECIDNDTRPLLWKSAALRVCVQGALIMRRHRRYDATKMMPGPCSRACATLRGCGQGERRRHKRYAVSETWARWGSIPVVFPPGMAGHLCPNLRATSFPSKENRQISERDDLGPPAVPGGQEISLGPRNLRSRAEPRPTERAVSKERLGDWDGQMDV
jgi:hypothetical protein